MNRKQGEEGILCRINSMKQKRGRYRYRVSSENRPSNLIQNVGIMEGIVESFEHQDEESAQN